MGLNPSKGNMYDFVTHTWNAIKGRCPHDCSYCYMKRFNTQREIRFDAKELKTDLGNGNFIFVGSSCDIFAEGIPNDWIMNVLTKMNGYDNQYLLQSKNPLRFARAYFEDINRPVTFCTTLETNRWYPDVMGKATRPIERVLGMEHILNLPKFVTIEPILDFDLKPFVELIKRCNPSQVNIGADSGSNNLPEPFIEKVAELIDALKEFTTVAKKRNLDRIIVRAAIAKL